MREVSKTITSNGKDYKIVFNLNVMEAIQAEYGTLEKWGELTDGKTEGGEVDVKALIFGLKEMINEGIEINNDATGAKDPLLTHKQVGRILTDVGISKATEDVNNLVIDSTKTEEDIENEKDV